MTDAMTNMWIAIPSAIFLSVVGLFIATLVLQWLWNMTMPDVFDIKKITYWQAFRLIIIAAIIFGVGRAGR